MKENLWGFLKNEESRICEENEDYLDDIIQYLPEKIYYEANK